MVADDLRKGFVGKVIPAVPVTFDSNGEINQELHARYVGWMNGQDVGAVAVWAHTGRGLRINADDRAQTLETWHTLGDHPLVAGVGVPGDERLPSSARARTDHVIQCAVDMARDARDGGAEAVLVHPPSAIAHLNDLDGRAVAYHEAIGDVLPFMAFYLYEEAGGVPYGVDLVDRIVELPSAIGIKLATLDSVVTVQNLCAQLANREGVLVVTGEDRFLGYSLTLGAEAALVGMGAAMTDVLVELLAVQHEEDLQRFGQLSAAVDEFARITFGDPVEGYIQRMLWALEDDNVLPPGAVDPFGPALGPDEREAVRRAVAQLRSVV